MITFDNVGKIYAIQRHNEYVILFGKHLLVYKGNGVLVLRRHDIVNPHKAIILSNKYILVDCGHLQAYILISLEDGTDIVRIAHPRMDISSSTFVVTDDERFIYDYFNLRGHLYILRIDTDTWEKDICPLQEGFRGVSDMNLDQNGQLCLLEQHYEKVADTHISINGIRYVYRDEFNPGSAYYWKYKWTFPFPRISTFFLKDTETVLTDDLYIYKTNSGEIYDLLENEHNLERPSKNLRRIQLSDDGKYLTLFYATANIIVDIAAKKIVARYKTNDTQGCLVNNEFWVYCNTGIIKKQFPLIENICKQKHDFWKP